MDNLCYRLYSHTAPFPRMSIQGQNSKFQIPNSKQIQKPNFQNCARKIRVGLYGVIAVLFLYFFVKDLNPSGELSVSYNLCRPSPYISEFSPHGRVLDIETHDGHCTQRMVIDPVYVDVRLPQRYDTATMTVVFQKSDEQPVSAGPWISTAEWQWALQALDEIATSSDGWQTAVAQFDIRERPLDHRRLRFMLSSPGLSESGREVVLLEARFTFEKPRFSWAIMKRWGASFYDR